MTENAHRQRWLIVGSATVDCVVQRGERVYKAGGVVVYAGLTLLRLGRAVAVCTNVASKDKHVIAPLVKEGAYLHVGESINTTHFVNRIVGDDREQEMPLAARSIGRTALQKAVRSSDCILLGPLHPFDIEEEAIAWLSAQRCRTICADIQGYIRRVQGRLVQAEVSASVDRLLQGVEWIKVAQEELDLLLAWAKCDLKCLMNRYRLREVVVTKGSKGGYVRDEGGAIHVFDSESVLRLCDPTGAGDVFFACYLSERIGRKEPIRGAVRTAARLAAEHVAGTFLKRETLLLS